MSTTTQTPNLAPIKIPDTTIGEAVSSGRRREALQRRASDREYFLQGVRTAMPMFVSDFLSVSVSVLLAFCVVQFFNFPDIHRLGFFLVQFLLTVLMVGASLGLYPGVGLHPACELRGSVFASIAVGVSSTAAAMVIGRDSSPYLPLSVISATLVMFSLFPLRIFIRWLCQDASWWGHPAVIVGPIVALPQLQRALRSSEFPGVRLVGQFAEQAPADSDKAQPCEYLGNFSDVSDFCKQNHVFWAFIPRQSLGEMSLECFSRKYDLHFRQIFAIDESTTLPNLWGSPVDLGGVVGVHLRERLLIPSQRATKRVFDLLLASLVSIALLPLLLAIAIAVKCTSKGPVIFGHRRIGLGGEYFKSLKFRTMVENADQVLETYLAAHPELREEWERDHKLKNDPRITCIGSFLRKSSLDELPQLLNVLRGEMSLVGPRPIVDAEIEKYGDAFDTYRRVRPGITGLWQISGRNNTTYPERVGFDRFYVRNWSPWYDLYILIRTIKTVAMREGAY